MPVCACDQTVVVDGVDLARCIREAAPGSALCRYCQQHHAKPEHAFAAISYDPDAVEVGRVAALRIKAGRQTPDDYAVLAEVFEVITRQLPAGE